MPLGGLQHYTIEPSDLERTKNFYCDVLGLENGDRPPLDFPGYWLYSGGTATVHLMGTRKAREGVVVRGTEKKYEDTGRLDHIAFAASPTSRAYASGCKSRNVKFREQHRAAHRRHPDLPLRSRRCRRGAEFPQAIRRHLSGRLAMKLASYGDRSFSRCLLFALTLVKRPTERCQAVLTGADLRSQMGRTARLA